jgi:DNA repair exonuclease SbcCD ATPase subunit|tara:strand:- start:1204 stop:2976 length:1773 start_codon:yes stop_codon:yes gene_type:complete
MLKLKNISVKNFMSVGNNVQGVRFDDKNLTLVLGNNLDLGGDGSRNGTGKTTIINALSYALYGEALTNIRRDNLINKTNAKGMIVSVDFELNGVAYRIERGRRPNILRFFVDGTEHADQEQQGDSRETQKDIEKVIGFTHEMFKHIVALNTYTEPFLGMKNNDQRDMIEQLLGIQELSQKAEVLKEKMKDTKDNIKEEEMRINAIKDSNARMEKNIKEIESRSMAWESNKKSKLLEMANALEQLNELDIDSEVAKHNELVLIKDHEANLNVLVSNISNTENSIKRSDTKLQTLEANLVKAREGVCPACGQDTGHLDTHEVYTVDLNTEITEERTYNDSLITKETELKTGVEMLGPVQDRPQTFYKTLEEALTHRNNVDNLIQSVTDKNDDINPYVDQIESMTETGIQDVSWDIINELTALKDHQEFLYKLLTSKDSFIRRRIIDQNIAYLNHRLAHYLNEIGLPHDVKFNSDLSVEITEYGRDLDFDNLSRGERNRLILSLSWAFRDIYESLNHPMNFLCIDELIDSGLDATGVENALGILKKMSREQNKNIMLISHREELSGRVNDVLYVIKEGGFTSYNTDTDYVGDK